LSAHIQQCVTNTHLTDQPELDHNYGRRGTEVIDCVAGSKVALSRAQLLRITGKQRQTHAD